MNVFVKLFYIVITYKLKEVILEPKKIKRPNLVPNKNKSNFNFEENKHDNIICRFFFVYLVDKKRKKKK